MSKFVYSLSDCAVCKIVDMQGLWGDGIVVSLVPEAYYYSNTSLRLKERLIALPQYQQFEDLVIRLSFFA